MSGAIARTGALLLPGGVLTWALLTLHHGLLGHYADGPSTPSGLLMVAGVLGVAQLSLWIGLSLVTAPFIASATRTRESAPVREVLLATCVVMAGMGFTSLTRPVAETLVPPGLDLRFAFVTSASWCLALSVGAIAGVVHRRRCGVPVLRALWPIAAAALLWRVLCDDMLRIVFLRFEHLLDLTLLATGTLCLWPLGLPPPSRWTRAGALLLIVATAAFALGVGHLDRARAELEFAHRGPAQLADGLRAWLDVDGDGFAAVLGGLDCDDNEPTVHPLAIEVVGNGIDENCDGADLARAPDAPPPPDATPAHRRSVVLLTIDALRSDAFRVGPNLTALGARGAFFPNTYTHAPNTDWALRSLMSGHPPMEFTDGQRVLWRAPSVPQRLARYGYRSLTPGQLQSLPGFPEVSATTADGRQRPTSGQLADRTIAGFERLRDGGEPFFLWMHFMDPHSDWLAHPDLPGHGSSPEGRYRQEVLHTDREIGRVLAALERADFFADGVVAVTADHGEMLGDRGRYSHSVWVDDGVLRVPSLVVGPGIPAGRFPTRVRTTDLSGALIEQATGIAQPRGLASVWNKHDTADRDVFFAGFYEPRALRGLVSDGFTYIQAVRSGAEALRLGAVDVAGENPEVVARLRRRVQARWAASLNDVALARKLSRAAPGR